MAIFIIIYLGIFVQIIHKHQRIKYRQVAICYFVSTKSWWLYKSIRTSI